MLNKVYHHIGYVNKCVVLGIFPCQTFEEMLNKQILSCCVSVQLWISDDVKIWHAKHSQICHQCDIFCDLLLYRPTTSWNVFVLRDKKGCVVNGDVIHASVLSSIKMCALFSLSYKFNLIAELKIYHLHSHEAFNTAGHGKQYA